MIELESRAGMTWGIFQRLIKYVEGVEDGTIEVSDGATRLPNGQFLFPLDTRARNTVRYRGRVTITAYDGMLRVTLVRPSIVVNEGRGTLNIENPHRNDDATTIATLKSIERRVDTFQARTHLTSAGSGWLSDGKYPTGQEVDNVSWQM